MNFSTYNLNLVFIYLLIKKVLKSRKRINNIENLYKIFIFINFNLFVILFKVKKISLLIIKKLFI